MTSIELTVADALVTDSGRGIARVDAKSRTALGLNSGDIIEIKGKIKSTAASIWQAHPSDEGLGFIRIDGYLRQNLGVGIGDKVFVSKAEVKNADRVVIAPPPGQKPPLSPDFAEYAKRRLEGKPIVKGDSVPIPMFGIVFNFVVVQVLPHGIVKVSPTTNFVVRTEPVPESSVKIGDVHYEDIGGLDDAKQKIREIVELPIRYPELFERLGIEPPKGVLLYGSPGTGKTLLARAVANESDANFISISGPELVSKFVGESEEKLREIFKSANEKAPSIIFMDEIDAIAPKREESTNEVERRMVSQLLTLMDGLSQRGQVIIVAATNRPDSIDPALRRPGRFDREIEIGVPNRDARKVILQIHTRNMPIKGDSNETSVNEEAEPGKSRQDKYKEKLINELADITHGYTGADLNALVREAAMATLREVLPQIKDKTTLPHEFIDGLKVTKANFLDAMKGIRPSALREVFVERPNVHWADVGGLKSVKQELKEVVELPLKEPEKFERMGIRPSRGVLLVGPPGVGKTLLAKAVATEREANFISIKGPEIISKFVGESAMKMREIFRKARLAAPCIIFIDEIDALSQSRENVDPGSGTVIFQEVLYTLLAEMDGLQEMKNVIVLAATNRPENMDPALLRPGRFDRIVEIGMPDEETRLEILRVHMKRMPLDKDVDDLEIARLTENYTGAEIENLCRVAGMSAIRHDKNIISKSDFEYALKEVRPAIPKEVADRIRRFKEEPESMYR